MGKLLDAVLGSDYGMMWDENMDIIFIEEGKFRLRICTHAEGHIEKKETTT